MKTQPKKDDAMLMRAWGAVALPHHPKAAPPPAGTLCLHCDEPFDEEGGFSMFGGFLARDPKLARFVYVVDGVPRVAQHRECMVRGIAGSVGHQQGRCSCNGGAEEDPPGVSRREAARQALLVFEATQSGARA